MLLGGLQQIHRSEMIEEAGIFKQLSLHIEVALLSHQSLSLFLQHEPTMVLNPSVVTIGLFIASNLPLSPTGVGMKGILPKNTTESARLAFSSKSTMHKCPTGVQKHV